MLEVALEGAGVLDLESLPLLEAEEAWTASDIWDAMVVVVVAAVLYDCDYSTTRRLIDCVKEAELSGQDACTENGRKPLVGAKSARRCISAVQQE